MPYTYQLEINCKSQELVLLFEFLRNSTLNLFLLSRYKTNCLQFRANRTVLDDKKLLSLPGQLDAAYFTNFYSIANIFWIYDLYKHHLHLMRMLATKCHTNLPWGFTCLNLSSGAQFNADKDSYMLLTKHISHTFLPDHSPNFSAPEDFLLTGTNLTSSDEASTLCTDFSGMLPVFEKKEKLEEVIALLKFVEDIPPIEGIFIGMKLRTSQQVSFCVNSHTIFRNEGSFVCYTVMHSCIQNTDLICIFFANRALPFSGRTTLQLLTRCSIIITMVNTTSSTTYAIRDSLGSISLNISV